MFISISQEIINFSVEKSTELPPKQKPPKITPKIKLMLAVVDSFPGI